MSYDGEMRVFVLLLVSFIFLPLPMVSAYDDTGTVSIQGTVPPKSDAFSLSLSSSTTGTLSQEETITYTVSYGTTGSATPVTLQVQWYLGTIEGAPSATVEVVRYEVGSATPAYGAAPAVVDLNARTITWNIDSLPASVGTQTVSFRLKTTSEYTGSRSVTIPVHARITSPVALSDRSSEGRYLYTPPTETATPTPAPTSTPLVALTTSTQPVIVSLSITEISPQSAHVTYITDTPATMSVAYGTQIDRLDRVLTETQSARSHRLVLPDLHANTRYYFQIFSIVNGIRTPISDVFTLDTATQTPSSDEAPILMTAAQSWGVSFSQLASEASVGKAELISLSDSVLDLQFSIPKGITLKSAVVIVRPPNVLGWHSDESEEFQSATTQATQIGNRIYVGKVKLPAISGKYEVVLHTEDTNGNIKESILGAVHVIQPLRMFDESGLALQNARILLSRYNEQTKRFEVLPNTATSVKNPIFSDPHGEAPFAALPGRYSAAVSLDGYRDAEFEFVIDPKDPSDFSPIILSVSTKSPLGYLRRQRFLFRDVQRTVADSLTELLHSQALLYAMITRAIVLLPLSLVVFSLRWQRRVLWRPKHSVIVFLRYLIIRLFEKFMEFYLIFSIVTVYLFSSTIGSWRTMLYGALILLHLLLWEVGIYRVRNYYSRSS